MDFEPLHECDSSSSGYGLLSYCSEGAPFGTSDYVIFFVILAVLAVLGWILFRSYQRRRDLLDD